MSKRPSFQFYPADWKKDLELQSCCLEARGLWIELLCIMHHASPYGTLRVNGEIPPIKVVSHLVGIHPGRYARLLSELERYGVIRKDESGAHYSKRMVDDNALSEKRRVAGALGGNPNLVKQGVKQTAKQKTPPSSSSSTSTSTSTSFSSSKKKKDMAKSLTQFEPWYLIYPRKIARGAAEKAWIKINPDEILVAKIMEGTRAQVEAGKLVKGSEFTPHPASWLNAGRWTDEIESEAPAVINYGFKGRANIGG